MPDEFWSLTPKEFHLMCEGYHDRQEREWKQQQVELHLLRFIGASIHNIGAGFSKDAEGIMPSDLVYLPIYDKEETEENQEPIDADSFKQLVKRDGKRWPQE